MKGTRVCSLEGCERLHAARGLCSKHYQKIRTDLHKSGRFEAIDRSRTCAVEGCDRSHHANGFCDSHNRRVKTIGVPGPVKFRKRGLCDVEGCSKLHLKHGYCAMHYARWRNHGDVNHTAGVFGAAGDQHYKWTGESGSYLAAHCRMRKKLGPARNHLCAQKCGARATNWAYDYKDPDARVDESKGLIYSLDDSYYQPLCTQCHNRFDVAMNVIMRKWWVATKRR